MFLVLESRGKKNKLKRKRKWQIILPIAILLKLTHLKILAVKILLGIGGAQLLLIVGGALLFHYLKNNTLCKIQPHLVHTHSHITEHEPGLFIFFILFQKFRRKDDILSVSEISYPSYGYQQHASPSYASGGSSGYSKDWATNRAYSAHSYLDLLNGSTKV